MIFKRAAPSDTACDSNTPRWSGPRCASVAMTASMRPAGAGRFLWVKPAIPHKTSGPRGGGRRQAGGLCQVLTPSPSPRLRESRGPRRAPPRTLISRLPPLHLRQELGTVDPILIADGDVHQRIEQGIRQKMRL